MTPKFSFAQPSKVGWSAVKKRPTDKVKHKMTTIREKLLSQKAQENTFTRFDPLFNEEPLETDFVPKFTSGLKITEELYRKIDASEDLNQPLVADKPILSFFEKLFPSIVNRSCAGIGRVVFLERTLEPLPPTP